MKTAKKKKPFWFKALNDIKFGQNYKLRQLRERAGSWVTCACGEQDKRIPLVFDAEYGQKRPQDKELHKLGVDFYGTMKRFSFCHEEHFEDLRKEAISTLHQIEARAGIVLRRELKKKGK